MNYPLTMQNFYDYQLFLKLLYAFVFNFFKLFFQTNKRFERLQEQMKVMEEGNKLTIQHLQKEGYYKRFP